jgi:outer membrane protein assembly factor BamB
VLRLNKADLPIFYGKDLIKRMRTSRLFPFSILAILAFLLSSCAGGTGAATSWPGLTVDVNNKVGYLAYNEQVYAINLENGNELWKYPSKTDSKLTFFAAPVLTSDGQLLVAGYDNAIHSLNSANGQENQGNWPFKGADNRYVASPLVAGDQVFAPNSNGILYALDLTGKLLWEYHTKEPLWATPATNGKLIFLPAMDHHIYALDAQSGNVVWQSKDLGGAVVGTPSIGPDGTLYVGSFGQLMNALNPQNGEILWSKPTTGWIWGGPTLDQGVLFFGDLDGAFYAMNAADGAIRWQTPPASSTGNSIPDRPLVISDTVYFNSENGTLFAASTTDGNPKSILQVDGKLYASPHAVGDFILITPVGKGPILMAVDKNGAQKWVYPAVAQPTSTP